MEDKDTYTSQLEWKGLQWFQVPVSSAAANCEMSKGIDVKAKAPGKEK